MKILFYFQAPQCLEKHNRTVRIVPPKDEGAFKLKNWLKLKKILCKNTFVHIFCFSTIQMKWNNDNVCKLFFTLFSGF